jgi:hypothetical protein
MQADTAEEKQNLMRGLIALHQNEYFRHLCEFISQEMTEAETVIFSGHFPNGVASVLLREQLIGEVRGLRRLPTLLLTEVERLRQECAADDKKDQEPNET